MKDAGKNLEKKSTVSGSKAPFPVGKGHSLVKEVDISESSEKKVIIGEAISENNLGDCNKVDGSEYRRIFCSGGALKFSSDNKIILEVRDLFRPTEDEGYCVLLINKFRVEQGLKPLRFMRALTNLITGFVTSMANGKIKFDHRNFLERTCLVPNIEAAAENIGFAFGFSNYVDALFKKWIKSPGHKENILGDYNAVGTTFVQNSKGEWFGCQYFARISNLDDIP